MKTVIHLITAIISILTTSALVQAQEKPTVTEKKVVLRQAAVEPARYVSIVKMGGLTISATSTAGHQIFTLIDRNGGELADGDEVQIKFAFSEGEKPNYWYETEDGKVARIGGRPGASSTFKLKKAEKGFSFQTASGKFVSAESAENRLGITDNAESAAVFEIADAPTVAPAASPASSPGPGQ